MTAAVPPPHRRRTCLVGASRGCSDCRSISRAVRGLMSYRAQVTTPFLLLGDLVKVDPVGAADVAGGLCDLRAAISLAEGWPPDAVHPSSGVLLADVAQAVTR